MNSLSNDENVIDFADERISYRFVQEVYKKNRKLNDGTVELKEYVLILLERKKGFSVRKKVHPITEFLLQPAKKGGLPKVASLKIKAFYIVKFLNYILIDNSNLYKVDEAGDLLIEHAVEFLNWFGESGVKESTVRSCENVLKDFYYFLCKKEVLKYVSLNDFEAIDNNQYSLGTYIKSPFHGVEYPVQSSKNILHFLPQELIMYFIDTAMIYTPEIAFGVYSQFFGGLRVGEIVNCTIHSISPKGALCKYGFVVNLKNRKLRSDLKHYASGGAVKKIRRQAVFPYRGDILPKLYEKHIKNYTAKDGSGALFANKDGKPMTDYSYRYYFNKLKAKFIERLVKSNDIKLRNYGIDLQAMKWSTHLGRGVFTNMIAEVATNIAQIRQARGDSTFDAAFDYLSDTTKMANALYENHLDMWEMLIEEANQFLEEDKISKNRG